MIIELINIFLEPILIIKKNFSMIFSVSLIGTCLSILYENYWSNK